MTRYESSIISISFMRNTLLTLANFVKALLRPSSRSRPDTLQRKLNSILNMLPPRHTKRPSYLTILPLTNDIIPTTQYRDSARANHDRPQKNRARLQVNGRITRRISLKFASRFGAFPSETESH